MGVSQAFTSQLLFFVSSANIIFSYDCQFALLGVYDSLKEKSEEILYKLNNYGIIVIALIMLSISIFGFLTSPVKQYELIIFRDALGSSDWFMSIGKMIVCFSVMFDISINFSSMRLAFFELFLNTNKFSNKK